MKVCIVCLLFLFILFLCTEHSESSSASQSSKAEVMRILRNILHPDMEGDSNAFYAPEINPNLNNVTPGKGQHLLTAQPSHKPPSLLPRWKKASLRSTGAVDDFVDAVKKRQWYVQNGVNTRFPLPERRKFPEVDWRGFNEDVFHESFGDFTPMKRSQPQFQQR